MSQEKRDYNISNLATRRRDLKSGPVGRDRTEISEIWTKLVICSHPHVPDHYSL